MKVDEWGNLLVSWASFLDTDGNIKSVDELSRSDLFPRLLRLLVDSFCHDFGDSNNNELRIFLQDQYPLLELGEVDSNCKESTILKATAFLIYCSLHHEENSLKKKMTNLPEWTQVCLTNFLKELVDVPKNQITREMIFSEISKLKSSSSSDSENLTPKYGSPLIYSTSPSTCEDSQKSSSSKKQSKVKKLRNEIELLNNEKSELIEELESTKEMFAKLESTVEKRDHEINRLKSELLNLMNKEPEEEHEPPDHSHEELRMGKLQQLIDSLESQKAKLEGELLLAQEENLSTYNELQNFKILMKEAESARKKIESDKQEAESRIADLKSTIEELTTTNKEQSAYIAELTHIRDDSKTFSDSQNNSLILPESLGQQIVDLEIHDLKETVRIKEIEIKDNLEIIERLMSKLKDMEEKCVLLTENFALKEKTYQSEIESKENTIKGNKEDLRNLESQNLVLSNTLREKEGILASMQSSLDLLSSEVESMRGKENALIREIQAKNAYNQQLSSEIDALTAVINENSTEKDLLIKTIAEKETALQQYLEEIQMEYDCQLKNLQRQLERKTEEARCLEVERMQISSTVDYYRNQLHFYESKLKEREGENLENINIISKLESDIEAYKNAEGEMKSEIDTYEAKIQEMSIEITSKLSHVSQIESDLSTLQAEYNDLLSKKSELEIQISRERELTASLESQVVQKEEQIKFQEDQATKEHLEFNSIIDDLKTNVDGLNSSKFKLQAENSSLQKELSEKFNIISSNVLKIEALQNEVMKLKCDTLDLKEELLAKEKNIAEFQCKIESLNQNSARLEIEKNMLKTDLENYEMKYKTEIEVQENLLEEIKLKGEQYSKLQDEIQLKEEVLNGLKSKLAEVENNLFYFQDKCEKLGSDKLALHEKTGELENKITAVTETLSEKELSILNLNNSLQCLNKQFVEQGDLVDSLKKDIENARTENSELKVAVTEKTSELQDLVSSMNTMKAVSHQQITTLTSEMEVFKNLNESLEQEVSVLKKEIKELEREKESALSKLATLDVEHSSCSEKVARLENLIHELKDKECILKDELNKTTERENNLKVIIEEKNITISSLQEDLAKKVESINILERDIKDIFESKENETTALKSQIDVLKKVAEHEKFNYKKMEEVIDEKNKEILEHLNHIKIIEKDFMFEKKTLNNDLENCKSLRDSLEGENASLKTEIKDIMQRLMAVEVEHSSCCNKIKNSESVICELKDKEMILKDELNKSNEREESLKGELQNKIADVAKLREEVKSLKKVLSNQEFEESIVSTKLAAKEAEVNQLKLELGKFDQQLKENVEKNREEIDLHIKKIQDLDSTIGKLNNQFIKVSREKENISVELEESRKCLLHLKTIELDCGQLKKDLKKFEEDLATQSSEISEHLNTIANYKIQVQAAREEKEHLGNQLECKNNEIQKMHEELHLLQLKHGENEARRADLLNELAEKNNLISQLESKIVSIERYSNEIATLKESISKKDELINNYAKEKNVLMLELDLHSKKIDFLNTQIENKSREAEDAQSKLALAEAETSNLKLSSSEQEQTIRSLYTTLHSQNLEIKEKDCEISHLQQEIKTLCQNLQTEKENKLHSTPLPKDGTSKSDALVYTEKDLENRIQELKTTYEKKVESYKTTVKKRFTEKLEDLTYSLQNENTDLKEKYMSEEERCKNLQAQLWETSDKLLIVQEQNRSLLAKIQGRNNFEVIRPPQTLSPISKARSMEVLSGRNRGIDNFARDISLDESVSSRRSSIRSLPRGMGKKFSFSTGKVFPAAEEDGEVFDNRYLADLKAGVCHLPADQERMSILQYRNSLCPPHLKSSYPAETQFINNLREDDIKSGLRANCEEAKKTKVQSAYKKPGPPTPSKNGGRLPPQESEKSSSSTPRPTSRHSEKEGVVNESFVLREINHHRSEAPRVKPPTPSRLKALFSNSKKDENSPKRKSLFMRRN